MLSSLLALFALPLAFAAQPQPFPPSASYTCTLTTTNSSSLCPLCTFEGQHHYSTDANMGFVQWVYGPIADPADRVNFMDVFHSNDDKMLMVQDIHSKPLCIDIPYPDPIFNKTWAADAVDEGHVWFEGRLTRKFSNTFPYFIQGEVAVSDYYEDVFTNLPVAFVNVFATLLYKDDFAAVEPDANVFTAVEELHCVAPPPGFVKRV